jgi:hypothetical protein
MFVCAWRSPCKAVTLITNNNENDNLHNEYRHSWAGNIHACQNGPKHVISGIIPYYRAHLVHYHIRLLYRGSITCACNPKSCEDTTSNTTCIYPQLHMLHFMSIFPSRAESCQNSFSDGVYSPAGRQCDIPACVNVRMILEKANRSCM